VHCNEMNEGINNLGVFVQVKAMEVARYARELEEAQREAAAEKQRRKDAYAA
jgi:hypothetical protein